MKTTTIENLEEKTETITVTTSNGTVITIEESKQDGHNYIGITDSKSNDREYGKPIDSIYIGTNPCFGIFDASVHTQNELTAKGIKRRQGTNDNHTWTSLVVNDGFNVSFHHSTSTIK